MSDEARYRVMRELWLDEQARGRIGLTIPELADRTEYSEPTINDAIKELRGSHPPLLIRGRDRHSVKRVKRKRRKSAGNLAHSYLIDRTTVTDNPCTAAIILAVLHSPGSIIGRAELITKIVNDYTDPSNQEFMPEQIESRITAALEPGRYLQVEPEDKTGMTLTITGRAAPEELYLAFLVQWLRSKR